MAEEGDGVSGSRARLACDAQGAGRWENDSVHGAPKKAVCPVRKQVADVDEDGGAWVRLGARGRDGHGGPGAVLVEDLETSLAFEAEEQRDGTVVGVGSCADVLVGMGRRLGRRVAEEAKRGA